MTMKTLLALMLLASACHAHQVAKDNRSMASQPAETGPKTKEVNSARPVRTTPGGFLDPKAMRRI